MGVEYNSYSTHFYSIIYYLIVITNEIERED